jgi:hypothetical protein
MSPENHDLLAAKNTATAPATTMPKMLVAIITSVSVNPHFFTFFS